MKNPLQLKNLQQGEDGKIRESRSVHTDNACVQLAVNMHLYWVCVEGKAGAGNGKTQVKMIEKEETLQVDGIQFTSVDLTD